MKGIILVNILMFLMIQIHAQEYKRGSNWVVGFSPAVKFTFDTNLEIDTFKHNAPFTPPICVTSSSSIISDTLGNLQFFSNGFIIYDKDGYAMMNGINVNSPKGNLLSNTWGYMQYDQSSIILPKKNNSYYVFSTGMSDSVTQVWINSNAFPGFDVLNYSVVDMDSNGGNGKVVDKNHILLDNQHYAGASLTAVRHANNHDWWLIKSDCYNHQYQKFLVKEDTILGPYYHTIIDTANYCDFRYGQMYFSEDGTKFASSVYQQHFPNSFFLEYNRVDVFNFDRTSGDFTFRNYYKTPVDTSTYPWEDGGTGIQFSPDGKLLYMSTLYSIYQIDIEDPNINNALYIHGPDTTIDQFATYHVMANGPDGKLYIGNFDGFQKYMSYIDKPNVKGLGCDFKAHGIWQPYTNLLNPPNMPNYGLGQYGTYPLANAEISIEHGELMIYPNPTSDKFQIRNSKPQSVKELYNSVGQMILSTKENEIDVSHFSKGVYYLRCENQSVKVVVE